MLSFLIIVLSLPFSLGHVTHQHCFKGPVSLSGQISPRMVLLVLISFGLASSRRTGPPQSACGTRLPAHFHTRAQQTAAPFKLIAKKNASGRYLVRIACLSSRDFFKGYMIHAFDASDPKEPIGTFTESSRCKGSASHSSNHPKFFAIHYWTPDPGSDVVPVFVATIARSYHVYWTDVWQDGYEMPKKENPAGCFSASSTVLTVDGRTVAMEELQLGDVVLSVDPSDGSELFSEVVAFLDINPHDVEDFVTLTTEDQHVIKATPDHLLFSMGGSLNPEDGYFSANPAGAVVPGDWVVVVSPGTLQPSRVVSVRFGTAKGVYAPLTLSGTLVVDGILASCYAVVKSHSLAQTALWPLRFFPWLRGEQQEVGRHWYANFLYEIVKKHFPILYLRN